MAMMLFAAVALGIFLLAAAAVVIAALVLGTRKGATVTPVGLEDHYKRDA